MSLYKDIKSLLDRIDHYIPYMETNDGNWCIFERDTVYYENNNDVYSGEIKEGVHHQEDCTLINIDTGCGETITLVLNNEEYMTYEDFEEKYGEYM